MSAQPNKKRKPNNDLLIKIGDKQFTADKSLLIEKLRFFARQISTEMLQKEQSEIVLDPEYVDPEMFPLVLEYMYTSDIKFDTLNIEPIYRIAEHLRFDALLNHAEKEMHKSDKTNAKILVVLVEVAKKYNLTALERECKEALGSNLITNVSCLDYEDLNILIQLMSDRKSGMLRLCIAWVRGKHDRLQKLPQILKNHELSTEFLNRIIEENSESLNQLIEQMIASNSRTSGVQEPQTSMTSGEPHSSTSGSASSRIQSECLYVIGGKADSGRLLFSLSKLDSSNIANKWITKFAQMQRVNFGCAVIDRNIYICGGWNGRVVTNELNVYDTETEQWSQLEPMLQTRQSFGMTALDGYVYIAGGKSLHNRINQVERYCVETNQWEHVTPMPTKRGELELVSMNGFLYAIGGYDGINWLTTVERYDPRTNQWKAVASLNRHFASFGSAVLDNRIYVASGRNCEVYDPEVDRWKIIEPPSRCEGVRRLAVYCGNVLAIGGLENGKAIRRVEKLQNGCWVPENDMPVGRSHHSVIVVKSI